MPSSVDEVRMVPASENDVINPGSFYFACLNEKRKTDPQSYWVVMRTPREWLPDGFFDIRPVRERVFPFWILGKDQRVWLPRSSLFYLDRTQKDMFSAKARLEYTNCFILIDSFINTDAALLHFKNRILESTKEYNLRRERVEKSVARRRRSSSMSSIIDNASKRRQPSAGTSTDARIGADDSTGVDDGTGADDSAGVDDGDGADDGTGAEPITTSVQSENPDSQADGSDMACGRDKSQPSRKRQQEREESALFFPEDEEYGDDNEDKDNENGSLGQATKERGSGSGQQTNQPGKRPRLSDEISTLLPPDSTDQAEDASRGVHRKDQVQDNQIRVDSTSVGRESAAASALSLRRPQHTMSLSQNPGSSREVSRVKVEEEEQQLPLLSAIQSNDQVRIYVHHPSREYLAKALMLKQFSPLLHSLIQVNKLSGERYIMHPELQKFHAADLLSVLEYMQNGEYNPVLVRNPDGNDKGPLALSEHTSSTDYSRSLAQSARLYTIAKTLQVKGMVDLVVRKVTRAQYKRYSNIALIKFAKVIFTRPMQGNNDMPAQASTSEECLDLWAIAELADNFMQIMRTPVEQFEYSGMIEMTKQRKIHAYVLEKAASNYRHIGGLPVVIEDSD